MTDTKWKTRRVMGGVAAATAPGVDREHRQRGRRIAGVATRPSQGSPARGPRPRLVAAVTATASSSAGGCWARRSPGPPRTGWRARTSRLPRPRADRDGHRQHQLPRRRGRRGRDATGWPRWSADAKRDRSQAVAALVGQAYVDLPLRKPADGVTPAGEAYTYSANDMSVGDVDGDGEYEYVVKWDPSNSKDVSQVGYTGPVYIDTYRADGTLLHRIDLGVNIRAGAHYTQFLVYDFDGDGRSEMMLKTAPGTKTIRYDSAARWPPSATSRCRERDRASRLLPHRRLPAERGRTTTTTWSRCSRAGTRTRRWWPGAGRPRWRRRSASRRATTTRCPEPTPRRWPTTSSTSTPRPAAPATTCGPSRASSSTARST